MVESRGSGSGQVRHPPIPAVIFIYCDRDDGHPGEGLQLTPKPREHPRLPPELLEHLKAEPFLDGPVEDLV